MTEKELKEIQAKLRAREEKLDTLYVEARFEEALVASDIALEALDKYESNKKLHDSYISTSRSQVEILNARAELKESRDAYIKAYKDSREADCLETILKKA